MSKFKISRTDNLDDFAENKLTAGDNITFTKISSGGYETLRIDVADQIDESAIAQSIDGYTVKVTSDDTQANFLSNKLVAGNNIILTVDNCSDGQTIIIDATDADFAGLNETVTEHYAQHSEAIDLIRQSMDGYSEQNILNLMQTVDEHYTAQGQINQNVVQALDGYAQNSTVTEHYNQQGQINQSILQALDAYGQGGTEAEHYHQQQEINSQILLTLDGYAQNSTVTENKNAQQQINQSILQALDGYGQGGTEQEHYHQQQEINAEILLTLDGYAQNSTITENKNAQYQVNQSILQALDGYAQNSTVTEHYHQQSEINSQILLTLDGYAQNWIDTSQQLQDLRDAADSYGVTQQENKNAQYQVNQSILQALDGYAQNSTVTEHYNQQGQVNQSILQALDGYGGGGGVSELTFTENKNAQEQINQTILQALDGYVGSFGGGATFQDAYDSGPEAATADTYTTISGTTIVANPGRYLVMFSTVVTPRHSDDGNTHNFYVSLFVDEVQYTHTERILLCSDASGLDRIPPAVGVSFQTVIDVVGVKILTVRYKGDANLTSATIEGRGLTIVSI